MLRTLFLLPLLCLAPTTPAAGDTSAPASGFHQVKLNGHTFTLPEGFTIELAAGPPLADRPIVAALDEKGRLYVCDSSGSNEKVTEQVVKKPHRIMRLESTKGDGIYDKSTVYVANVMFPEGAMWLNGSLYVAAPPHIWKFTDTDGDGKADKEEIWFDGKTLTGCANDLHGPYLGPDGWIYWCKGAFAEQKYTVNGKPFVTKASHIFRARPDGTGLEPVMTGGMDNPVDVVFTPSGERIFSCTFLQHPANGKRDGLIHAVYGGVYGKDHAPVYDHPWTSPKLMEPMTHLGPAAPCGLHRYESDQFGKDYENNLFCCQFNLRKVSRHVLVPSGSTYVTKDSDFVVSDQHDFHPTDVIEDADGSLLILDTGGWYKLCCPSSQLVKPDVKGAIYRVKKVGAHKVADPRGEMIEWGKLPPGQLATLVGDRRPAVARHAAERFAEARGADVETATALLNSDLHQAGRLNVLRALYRRGNPALVEKYLRDKDSVVRSATCHLIALRGGYPLASLSLVHTLLTDEDQHVRRAAAEALGRIGHAYTVGFLLAALADEQNDRVLDHSLTFALFQLGRAGAEAPFGTSFRTLRDGLGHKSPRVRRAVLVALERILPPKGMAQALPDAEERQFAFYSMGRDTIDLASMTADQKLFIKRSFERMGLPVPKDDAVITKAQFLEECTRVKAGLTVFDAKYVLAELASKDAALRETAWWIAGKHPAWGDQLAGYFSDQLKRADKLSPAARDELADRLAKFAKNEAVQKTMANALKDAPKDGKTVALRTMARSGLKTMPEAWTTGLLGAAATLDDRGLLREALAAFRAIPVASAEFDKFAAALPRASLWPAGVVPDEYRLALLVARPPGAAVDDSTARYLFAKIGRDEPPAIRSAATDVLARAALTPGQFKTLAGSLKTVGPVEAPKLIDLFGKSKDEVTGLALVAALSDPKVLPSVRIEVVKPILDKYPPPVRAEAEKLYAKLAEARQGETAKLERLLKELPTGDIRRGQAVFNGAKAQCAACHKIGYVGGLVGPDLTKIGSIRTERDLLEAIVFPSASFVRSYEPVRVVTLDGRVLSGILKKDAPDEIVLTIAADKEERIARADVESIAPGTVSVMPDGFDKQVTPQELADLVAFLKACK